MLANSLILLPSGFAQILFVPKYWNPPSFLNLNSLIGFDVESLVFSFSIGGISIALYELFIVNKKFTYINTPRDHYLIIGATTFSVFLFLGAYKLKCESYIFFYTGSFFGRFFNHVDTSENYKRFF
jgi:hypothetical protein